MNQSITVGISDMKTGKENDILATYALGSCVGICLYDKTSKKGALGHILLPDSKSSHQNNNLYKFADTCIPEMVKSLVRMGCKKQNLVAKIAGGASMFQVAGNSSISNIGMRNVEAVKQTLRSLQVKIIAEDVGENYGRTVFFHLENGTMRVKSFANSIKQF